MQWNLLYILDVCVIVNFAIFYYRNCYRKGYRIDIWHSQVLLFCILPNQLMFFVARSDLNGIILGSDLAAVIAVMPQIFMLTVLAYCSVLAGGNLWRLKAGVGVRHLALDLLGVVPKASLMIMSSRNLLILQAGLCFCLQVAMLAIYFAGNGIGFDLRLYTMAHPILRPLALIVSTYTVLIGSHCLARYMEKRERALLACTLLLTFGLVFFGSRGNVVSIYLNVLLCLLIQRRRSVNLVGLAVLLTALMLFGLYLGNVRSGEYSLNVFFSAIFALIFFGNTFSDLRDFAWVYSAWDHKFWFGKTYLAAVMAFVPRVASEFRDTWGLGVVTATTVGFDPQVHPGLRPGAFGEGFFNFGWFGVCAMGLILGAIFRRVDVDVKLALAPNRPSMMKALASTMLLNVAAALSVTAGFSALYILTGIYLFSWLCNRLYRMIQQGGSFHSAPYAASRTHSADPPVSLR